MPAMRCGRRTCRPVLRELRRRVVGDRAESPSHRGPDSPRQGRAPTAATTADVDEYCTVCGHRRAEPDRDEADLGGIVLITDRGIEHARNEDAAAAGILVGTDVTGRDAIAVAVCDGVSTSDGAHTAAVAASTGRCGCDARRARRVPQGTRGGAGGSAGRGEGAAAAAATDPASAPSCTYTAATVVPTSAGTTQITVGNVGDSRAYWLPEPPAAPQQLTVDDSLAQELITAGAAADSEAVQRGAHTLTRWLGADTETEPWSESSVQTITAVGPGWLVLCTDGLWNYLPDAADIARFCTRYRRERGRTRTHRIRIGCRWPGQHHRRCHPDRRDVMSSAEQQGISVDVDHNPYLAEGSGTVDAIVSIAADVAAKTSAPERVEAIIIDCSTSMQAPIEKFDAAKRATAAAIMELVDGTHFTVMCGTEKAVSVYPVDDGLARASTETKAAAMRAVDGLRPHGGTAMGTWLAHVRGIVGHRKGALTHAILLTDGKDEHETPEELGEEIGLSEGEFTCDCRGVGTDWEVDELRAISTALLGTVDIVADPEELAEDFASMMRVSMSKSIPDLTLRLWTPVGAHVEFVKQVAPTVEDLTHRRLDAGNQCGEYPLGSWGAEDRDYHIQVDVEPAAVGREKLAARVSVVAGEQVLGEGLVKAVWTADTALSAQISRRVAHYTGQAELAQAVQEGLSARKAGDTTTATAKLQRAMELAVESGNDGTAKLLRGVVEVDERTGTVRLRRDVAAADEMALDARSTRTARVRKET